MRLVQVMFNLKMAVSFLILSLGCAPNPDAKAVVQDKESESESIALKEQTEPILADQGGRNVIERAESAALLQSPLSILIEQVDAVSHLVAEQVDPLPLDALHELERAMTTELEQLKQSFTPLKDGEKWPLVLKMYPLERAQLRLAQAISQKNQEAIQYHAANLSKALHELKTDYSL